MFSTSKTGHGPSGSKMPEGHQDQQQVVWKFRQLHVHHGQRKFRWQGHGRGAQVPGGRQPQVGGIIQDPCRWHHHEIHWFEQIELE